MKNEGFVLNKRSGTLHRRPTSERCNVDAVPRKYRLLLSSFRDARAVGFKRRCKVCFQWK